MMDSFEFETPATKTRPQIGKVIIVEPFDSDPVMNRSVILLASYSYGKWTGLILNKKMDLQLCDGLSGVLNEEVKLHFGGIESKDRMLYIHDRAEIEGSFEIAPGLFFGGDFEQVLDCINSGDTNGFKFFAGHMEFSDHELQEMVESSSVIVSDINACNVLMDGDGVKTVKVAKGIKWETIWGNEYWTKVVRSIKGQEYFILSNFPLDPTLN
jgi:putative transcriptional regulator